MKNSFSFSVWHNSTTPTIHIKYSIQNSIFGKIFIFRFVQIHPFYVWHEVIISPHPQLGVISFLYKLTLYLIVRCRFFFFFCSFLLFIPLLLIKFGYGLIQP
uniref:Uncharacterized protein n=1 Tax=Lepeophtheirus salmonis TaxID=72036 RepID=A0A0K2TLA8_LEPSM